MRGVVLGKSKTGPYVSSSIKWECRTSVEGQEELQMCTVEIAHYRKSPCLRESTHQTRLSVKLIHSSVPHFRSSHGLKYMSKLFALTHVYNCNVYKVLEVHPYVVYFMER